MKRYLLLILLGNLIIYNIHAQGFVFGLKAGPTIGVQQWDGSDRDPLFKYHGILFIESLDEANNFSVFAQAGYHVKGSAVRYNFRPVCIGSNGQFVECNIETQEYRFNNLSLTLGGKRKFDYNNNKVYYLFGIRGDLTLNTNLDEYEAYNQYFPYYPFDEAVNKLNYGVTLGGGIEFPMSDLIDAMVELTVNPDFSKQYFQPPIPNITNPYNGESYTIRERSIRNITFEITFGFRFKRIVEYID